MEIRFAPRGILRTVWMKAFFHEVPPQTVNIRNHKDQPPPPPTNPTWPSKGMAARPALVLEQPELLFPTGLNPRQRSPVTAHKEGRSRLKGGGFAHYRRRLSEVYSDIVIPINCKRARNETGCL